MIIAQYMPAGSQEEQRLSLAQTIPLINAETHDGRYGQMRPADLGPLHRRLHSRQAPEPAIDPA